METIKFKVPKEYYNQLNNFYLDNFGYDIYTQIQNFISEEMKRCEDSSMSVPCEHPHPYIRLCKEPPFVTKYKLVIQYPDNSTLQVYNNDYWLLVDIWNEWSKYKFSKESKDKVLLKYIPEKVKYVNVIGGRYVLIKPINHKKVRFGVFSSPEDAYMVKCFLDEHGWDMKYHHIKLISHFSGCNINNYSDYLLRIVRGELSYEDEVA